MPRKIHNVSQLQSFQTIAHTLSEHERDPRHRFHARSAQADQRQIVSAGARLQRMRGRSHVG